MFLDSWSLALTLLSFLSLLLIIGGCWTGLRVLLYWDPASDGNRQITLENEIWLSSTLIEYCLGFQILSLVVFVLAADHFCKVIPGAMCATGALMANSYGIWALMIKIAGVFVYGYWIILHRVDISVEQYPLVKHKYVYLLCLFPFLLADALLQSLYMANLNPDIITSCCGIIFAENPNKEGENLLVAMPREGLLLLFYALAVVVGAVGLISLKTRKMVYVHGHAAAWFFFFFVAVMALTRVISSYIYAMPFHNCPFCMMKPEYNYVGFLLFGTLMTGTFFGTGAAVAGAFAGREDLKDAVRGFVRAWLKISLAFLVIFMVLSSYHYLMYYLVGGES